MAFLTASYHPLSSFNFNKKHILTQRITSTNRPKWNASLIAIAGATGGVGQHTVSRLLEKIETSKSLSSTKSSHITQVRALVKDLKSAKEILPVDNQSLTLTEVGLTQNTDHQTLEVALKDVSVLIISIGVPAFPSDMWKDGNNPRAVFEHAVCRLIDAVDRESIERIIVVSSIGTKRRWQFPFCLLNLFGTLDAKNIADEYLRNQAIDLGYSYAIIRPGRLVGKPHTNKGMLKVEPHPKRLSVQLAKGDQLAGDCSRASVADAVVTLTEWDKNVDFDISMIHVDGPKLQSSSWYNSFVNMQDVRKSITNTLVT